jgi:hypothetical protein
MLRIKIARFESIVVPFKAGSVDPAGEAAASLHSGNLRPAAGTGADLIGDRQPPGDLDAQHILDSTRMCGVFHYLNVV